MLGRHAGHAATLPRNTTAFPAGRAQASRAEPGLRHDFSRLSSQTVQNKEQIWLSHLLGLFKTRHGASVPEICEMELNEAQRRGWRIPLEGGVQTTKKGASFTLCDASPHVFRGSPSRPLTPVFQAQTGSNSAPRPGSPCPKGQRLPIQIYAHGADLLRFGTCVQEALILGNN